MAWYQYKNQEPTNGLPNRIRIDDGSVRRDLQSLTLEELSNIGISTIPDPPHYESDREDLVWNNDDFSWKVVPTTNIEKINNKWEEVNFQKRLILSKLIKKVEEHCFEKNVGLTTCFKLVSDKFDEVIPQNYTNPFVINMCNMGTIGISSSIGISIDELKIIAEAFVEFSHEYVYIQSYEHQSDKFRELIDQNIQL